MTPTELTGYVDENHQLRVEVPHDMWHPARCGNQIVPAP
jgi:hypothetical protein